MRTPASSTSTASSPAAAASSAMWLMSTTTAGDARRIERIGTRLWPPASTLASPPARASAASSTESGRRYANGAGFTRASPPLVSLGLVRPSLPDTDDRSVVFVAQVSRGDRPREVVEDHDDERSKGDAAEGVLAHHEGRVADGDDDAR